jgi:hypothetical protein
VSNDDRKLGWKTPMEKSDGTSVPTVVPFPVKQVQPKCECDQCARLEKIRSAKARLAQALNSEILPILDEAVALGVLLEFALTISCGKYEIGRLTCMEQHS